MPFVDPPRTDDTGRVDFTAGDSDVSVGEVLGAAFQMETIPGSIYNDIRLGSERRFNPFSLPRGHSYEELIEGYESGFNPLADLEPKYRPYSDQFKNIVTQRDADIVKQHLDVEIENRDVMERAGGLASFAAVTAVQFLDPVNYIPVAGQAYRGASLAQKMFRGVKVGLYGTAMQEPLLWATQRTRTGQEVALNIGAGAAFGGLLGAGGHILSRGKERFGQQAEVSANKAAREVHTRIMQSYRDLTPTEAVTVDVINSSAEIHARGVSNIVGQAVRNGVDEAAAIKAADVIIKKEALPRYTPKPVSRGTDQVENFAEDFFQSGIEWKKSLEKFRRGEMVEPQSLSFGRPSQILREKVGLSKRPLRLSVSKVRKLQTEHPEISDRILDRIDLAIQNPEFALKSATEPNSVVLIPVRLSDERVLVVPVRKDVEGRGGGGKANQITSIYLKDDPKWLDREIKAGRLIYHRDGKVGDSANQGRSNSGSGQSFSQTDLTTPPDGIVDFAEGVVNPRGKISFVEGPSQITLYNAADASTLVHEGSHHFLKLMQSFDAELGKKSPFADDLKVFEKWAGTKDEVGRQEDFARGFEAYLFEGVAPNPGLQSLFERFRVWMRSIYQSADELGVNLSDEMRAIYVGIIEPDISYWKGAYGSRSLSAAAASENVFIDRQTGEFRALTNDDFQSVSKAGRVIDRLTFSKLTPNKFFRSAKNVAAQRVWFNMISDSTDSAATRSGAVRVSTEEIIKNRQGAFEERLYRIFGNLPAEHRGKGDFGQRLLNAVANPANETDEAVRRIADDIRNKVIEPISDDLRKAGLLADDRSWSMDQYYSPHNWSRDKLLTDKDAFEADMSAWVAKRLKDHHAEDMLYFDEKIGNLNKEVLELDERIAREIGQPRSELDGLSFEELDEISRTRVLKPERPRSLKQFIIDHGGLWKGDAGDIAELEYRRPGFIVSDRRGFKRNGGMTLDEMREIASEAGYLADDSDVNDLIDAIAKDVRDGSVYSRDDLNEVEAWQHYEEFSALKSTVRDDDAWQAWKNMGRALGRKKERLNARAGNLESEQVRLRDIHTDPAEFTSDVRDVVRGIYSKLTSLELPKISEETRELHGIKTAAKSVRSLKQRSIDVPRSMFSRYMDNDAPVVLTRMARRMTAEATLTERYGSPDMAAQRYAIAKEYENLILDAKGDEAVSLAAERDRALGSDNKPGEFELGIQSLKGMRGLEYQSKWADTARTLMNFSYSAHLGGVTVSSIPDVIRPMFGYGMQGLINHSWPAFKRNLNIATKEMKLSLNEAGDPSASQYYRSERFGLVIERAASHRAMIMADVDDPVVRNSSTTSRLLSGSEKLANISTHVSGINRWNQFWKGVTADIAMDRLHDMAAKPWGKLNASDQSWLSILRVSQGTWDAAREQMLTFGSDRNGVFHLNTDKWSDQGLAEDIRGVIRSEADSVIVTPGVGDRLSRLGGADLQSPLAKMVLQYKSFFIAANERLLYRMAQNPDAGATLSTMLMMVVTGMAVDQYKALSGGYELSDNIGTRVMGGIDRSGIIPIWMELNNVAEKAASVPGLYRTAGAIGGDGLFSGGTATRYAQRNALGNLAGASAGLISDTHRVITDLANETQGRGEGWTDSSWSKLRNITPMHNAPVIRELTNLLLLPALKGD